VSEPHDAELRDVPVAGRLATMRAYATHAFTATGAVFALLALLAAIDARWSMMFLWLIVAFVVDGIDGPMARRYDVVNRAPIIDGALLDLIVDYLTYVLVPVVALLGSGLLAGPVGFAAALIMMLASALYFADTRMKTPDRSFAGFPACWNMFALVVFATGLGSRVVLILVAVLTLLMFTPVKFVHPVRTVRWRRLTLPVALAWTALAAWAAFMDLTLPVGARGVLLATSGYLLVAGGLQQTSDLSRSVAGRRASLRR
jgi:phosphatidylcholine synthase